MIDRENPLYRRLVEVVGREAAEAMLVATWPGLDPVWSPYLVWSNEHVAWWRPGRSGYTMDIREAGVYSETEARDIVAQATLVQEWDKSIPNELPVRLADLPEEARALVGRHTE